MKKIALFFTFLPLFSLAQKNSQSFTVVGSIKNAPGDYAWIFISYNYDGKRKVDSIRLQSGKYSFKGKIAEPVLASIFVKYPPGPDGKSKPLNFKRDAVNVFLEKGRIKVISKDSLGNKTVKGSTIHNELVKLNKAAEPFNNRMDALYKKYSEYKKNNDVGNFKKTEEEIETLTAETREAVYGQYARNNPSSPLALYAVKQYAAWDIDPVKVEPLFDALSPDIQKLPSALELKEKIETAKKTAIGKDAIDFSQSDTLGIPVSLSSFRGKYILIDFWASWCRPCREENPNLVTAFQKYKDKNFHILGVSLDLPGQKERWMKAIHEDKLEWTHVSDLKFWQNEVAILYGIQAIPQNVLVDPVGKIIAKNIRGDELDKKLEELIVEGKKIF